MDASEMLQEEPKTPPAKDDVVQDAVTHRIGKWGRWQLGVFLLLGIKSVIGAWQAISPNFTAPDLDHWCARPGDPAGPWTNMTAGEWKEFAIPPREHAKVSNAVVSFG
jgi:OCT family organic cation transporter-like MFS transporter 4/5